MVIPGLEIPEWPYFLGKPGASGVIRCRPEDFVVEEISRVKPGGEGGHLWLWVEKRSANTDWVAGQLAKVCACRHRDVGYAGLKDRHAVTRQWFSVPVGEAGGEIFPDAQIEGVRVLESRLHQRKLKRGTLDGNRFELVIRNFDGDVTDTSQRLERISLTGVPNYFGPQRFGHGGRNVEKAYSLLNRGVRLPRNKKSIYLSALRSFLFNQVLAKRVLDGSWDSILGGELVMLNGSHSIFPCEQPDTDIEDRCRRLDIHPTGPMPGEGGDSPVGMAAALENEILGVWAELNEVLLAQRVKASRRSLRLYPARLEWKFVDDALYMGFDLPPGAYATTVLREILVFSELDRKMEQNR
ncbi:MAG: tRNA pseudouridine(13) synthase TruD [Xanthomonadales bacterium]|nr:tRNA pseudouridine(13) synthase TruD [Xanthomonadales bacterium]